MAFTPYNRDEPVRRHRLKLPHWRQWGRTYFVTSRLADALPSPIRDEWLQQRTSWLAQRGVSSPDSLSEDERNDFHRKFTARFHELLDAGHGSCCLSTLTLAELLVGEMVGNHGMTYRLDAWIVMPNHFHALVEPAKGHTLGSIVRKWKGASARAINQALGRGGTFWQAEVFDHIVRSERQLEHFRRYIAGNPAKAGLHEGFVLGKGDCVGIRPDEM